jgi:UDP-glucose 6-dehydrogenase
MKIAIMQPYFFPYIGYIQLINAVDKFVIYDNIQYTKKGWINRNRILVNGKAEYISLPLKKGSDYLDVNERKLAETFAKEKVKLLNKIAESYKKAPYFESIYPVFEAIMNYQTDNLFEFIYRSITGICNYLDIKTQLIISSTIPIDHSLKSQDKVLAICKELEASQYINSIGGTELYSKEFFKHSNIILDFIRPENIIYRQYNNEFIPWLSIIDVLMFNSKESTSYYLSKINLN